MKLAWFKRSLALWQRRHRYRQRRLDAAHRRNDAVGVRKWHGLLTKAGQMIRKRRAQIDALQSYAITTQGGARGIVDQAFGIARRVGGPNVYVGSAYRPSSYTTSGNRSDHSENNTGRAARDIGRTGYNLLSGPPTPELDKAVVAIGKALGRNYGDGKHRIVDSFYWRGYRVQIIWRTPEYGGHQGHIHIGARA